MQAVREINNTGYGDKMEESRSITDMLKINKIRATFGERNACPVCLSGGVATLLDMLVSLRCAQRVRFATLRVPCRLLYAIGFGVQIYKTL
jgi:hypothetical protein